MKAVRHQDIQSGFICQDPMANLRALAHCGEATCVPGAKLDPASHEVFEFLYVISGSASWNVGKSTKVEQQMGELFVVRPREVHGTAKPLPALHHLWIGLELEKLGPEGRRLSKLLGKSKVHLLPNCHGVEAVLRAIVAAVVTPMPDQRRVVLAYLDVFFVLLQQRLKIMELPEGETQRTLLPYSYQVQTALSYMQRNLHRYLPLSELVHVIGMRHVSSFCMQFGREVGASPAAHHLQLRLESARSALLKPSEDLASIAVAHGFNSQQHFSTAFRRAFGTTPLHWKKRHAG